MHSKEAKLMKCDRCKAVVGLYRHNTGYRCPQCIWGERENLIEWSKNLLSAVDYTHNNNKKNHVVVVSRRGLDALAEVVKEVTTIGV